MSKRFELNDQELEDVTGGLLQWKASSGTVNVYGDTSTVYTFDDYTRCRQWLVANWNSKQTAECLQAMEDAGLIHKVEQGN